MKRSVETKKITCNLITFLGDEAIFFLKNNSILFANLQVPLFYLPGMNGLPNFAVGPVTLTSILYPQPAVDIDHSRCLPKNSDTMKLKRIFQGPMKT